MAAGSWEEGTENSGEESATKKYVRKCQGSLLFCKPILKIIKCIKNEKYYRF